MTNVNNILNGGNEEEVLVQINEKEHTENMENNKKVNDHMEEDQNKVIGDMSKPSICREYEEKNPAYGRH